MPMVPLGATTVDPLMHRALALCFALLFLAPLAASTTSLTLEDPAGDIDGTVPGRDASADLLRLEVDEDPVGFTFHLQTGVPEDDTRTYTDGAVLHVQFRHGAFTYRVTLWEFPSPGEQSTWSGELEVRQSPGGGWSRVQSVPVEAEPGRLGFHLDRDRLVDQDDVVPFRGGSLTDLSVRSQTGGVVTLYGLEEEKDRMPDAGAATAPVLFGAAQEGSLRLATDIRFVASNGAATSYLWRINATNLDDAPATATLALSGVDDPLEVRLPYERIALPANGSVEFPVLVTVPFQHAHGAVEAFLLEMRGLDDPASVGRLELGVEYLDVPQPAGHHDTVAFHTRSQGGTGIVVSSNGQVIYGSRVVGTFNTDREDPWDTDEPLPAQVVDDGPTQQRYGWVQRLDPALRLGIDMELDAVGTLEVPLRSPWALTDATVHGFLGVVARSAYTWDAADYTDLAGVTVLADAGPSPMGDLAGEETVTARLDVLPRSQAEVFERSDDHHLVLVLWLEGGVTAPVPAAQGHPTLEPGGWMRLPLDEYRDPIDTAFAAPDFLSLRLQGAVERFVAPGGTALYNLTLHNGGNASAFFQTTVSGANAEWARVLGDPRFHLEGNSTAAIQVAVEPPADTPQGTAADIVVETINELDPRMRGLVRLVTTVDGDKAVLDDTEAVQAIDDAAAKDTPAPGLIGLLLLSGAALLARRRR